MPPKIIFYISEEIARFGVGNCKIFAFSVIFMCQFSQKFVFITPLVQTLIKAGVLPILNYFSALHRYLVAVAGTSLSIISLIFNVLIVSVLLRPKHSHFFFLGLLALSDSFLSFCYGPVIAMDIIKNRLQVNVRLEYVRLHGK